MDDRQELEATLNRARARWLIITAERALKKAKHQRARITADEISDALAQKAYSIGLKSKADPNPFANWPRADSQRLASSYDLGRGSKSGSA